MQAEEIVAHLAPNQPRLRQVRSRTNPRIQLEDPPLPLQEVENVHQHPLYLRRRRHAGLPLRRAYPRARDDPPSVDCEGTAELTHARLSGVRRLQTRIPRASSPRVARPVRMRPL